MKHAIKIAFVMAMLLPTLAYAQAEFDATYTASGDVKLFFKKQGSTLELIAPQDSTGVFPWLYTLVIPDSVECDGTLLPVTSIADEAFMNCYDNLRSLTTPATLRKIGDRAFYNCVNLYHANFASGLQSIGSYAFCKCNIDTLTLPSSVYSMGEAAFQENLNLKSLTLSPSLITIPDYAFKSCQYLDSITIPDNTYFIGKNAFAQCSYIKKLTLGSHLQAIREGAFSSCQITKLVIPKSVTTIEPYAFSECRQLKKLTLDSITASLQPNVFNNCVALDTLRIPATINSINGSAFAGCSGLKCIVVDSNNVQYDSRDSCNAIIRTGTGTLILGCRNTVIPDDVLAIGDHAFDGCTQRWGITLNSNLTRIGNYAFRNCTNLQSITIPGNVDSIGDYAFYGCTAMKSVTLGYGIKMIGAAAFSKLPYLTKVSIPNSVVKIKDSVFASDSQLDSVAFGNGVDYVPAYGFYGCKVSRITLPPVTRRIKTAAFSGSRLFRITMPDSLEYIGSEAFRDCKLLKLDSLPRMVNYLGGKAFFGCEMIDSLRVFSEYPPIQPNPSCKQMHFVIPCGSYYNYFSAWNQVNKSYTYREDYPVKVTLDLQSADSTQGRVSIVPQGFHIVHDIGCDSSAIILAEPYKGWLFYKWSSGSKVNPDTVFLNSNTSMLGLFRPDVSPNICGVSVENDGVHVSWYPNYEVNHYKVYRLDPQTGNYEHMVTLNYEQMDTMYEWIDTLPPPHALTHTYIVVANDLLGEDTPIWNPQTTARVDVKEYANGNREIRWMAHRGIAVGGYAVFRGFDPDSLHEIAVLGIDDHYFYVDTLKTHRDLYYRVAAMRSVRCRPGTERPYMFSNMVFVKGDEEEAIDDIELDDGINIAVREGRIVVLGAEGKDVEVYDMLGRRVGRGSESPVLPQGVYVVRIGERTVRKAVVVR